MICELVFRYAYEIREADVYPVGEIDSLSAVDDLAWDRTVVARPEEYFNVRR